MELTWVKDDSVKLEDCWNCIDENGKVLAWITKRNYYCDRGHYKGMVDIPGIDAADSWPNYYMKFDRAKDEIIDFLKWRLKKIPAEPHDPKDDNFLESMIRETNDD